MRTRTLIPALVSLAFLVLLLSSPIQLAFGSPLGLEGKGTIVGKVVSSDGAPLSSANVVIIGTQWGGASVDDGTFTIENVPVGTYSVQASVIGHETQTLPDIPVSRDGTTALEFTLTSRPVGIIPEVLIVHNKLIDEKDSQIGHVVAAEDWEGLPVDEMQEVLGLKVGVVVKGGETYLRGSRPGEVNVAVDGVPVKDPLVGGGGAAFASLALESTEAILGGMDAEWGNAQAGVINYTTKEGGREFEGQLFYMTDDFGQPDNTFDNLDRVFLGLGGPTPIRNLTYYVSAEGTYADAYPATPRDRSRSRILNFISIGDRKSNTLRFQSKLAYKPGPNYKLTGEVVYNRQRSDPYLHMWSRVGYVQTYQDTLATGEVLKRRGRWSPVQVDDTYEYYNPSNRTPTNLDTFGQLKLVWNQTLDQSAFYTVKVSRNSFFVDSRVRGQNAWEYEGDRENDLWFNYTDGRAEPFFVISGDYPALSHRGTLVYNLKADLTKRYGSHSFKTGVDVSYNDMSYYQVDRPYRTNSDGEIGGTRTEYHYFNPEGAVYVQDRWEHEGMVLNLGVRFDVFSVGDQLDLSEVRDRIKKQLSPRVGVAYPISDRDVFTFHYGRFYQIPERRYLFDNRNALDGRVQGNANLTNMTTVSYQAGIQHLFNRFVSGQFSIYYKDIFGLISTESGASLGTVGNTLRYVNRDYASARGFEATLTRRYANGFSGEINYGFGVATGVASDPNAAAERAFVYLPISEQALDWDVRHTFSAQAQFADPGNWRTSFVCTYSSGFPYTPESRDSRELKPENTNSRRLPSSIALDIQAEKHYLVWGQAFKLFLRSRNILDANNITSLSPGNWPAPPSSIGDDYAVYYTETGKAGGAYIGEDTNGDGLGDWVALNDPRVFLDPRNVRVGLQLDF